MNQGYSQSAVSNKKSSMAQKMLQNYTMNGKFVKATGGMVAKQNGGESKYSGGEKVNMNGQGGKAGHGEKATQANKKGHFIGKRFYSQNG